MKCQSLLIAHWKKLTSGNTIVITPANPSITTGNTQQMTATEYDSSGRSIALEAGTWSSSDPTNAPIDSIAGLVTGNGVTTATIRYTVTATGVFYTDTVTVAAPVSPLQTLVTLDPNTYANDAAFRAKLQSVNSVWTAAFTITPAITASGSPQTVAVSSAAKIFPPDNATGGSTNGDSIAIGGANPETITPSAVDYTNNTIMAIFTQNHAAGVSCSSAMKGTGTSGAAVHYGNDAINVDLFTLDSVNTYPGSNKTLRQRFPRSTANYGTLPHYSTNDDTSSTLFTPSTGMWVVQYVRFDPAYYATYGPFFYGKNTPVVGGNGYKLLSFSFNNQQGRSETEWTSATWDGTTGRSALGQAAAPTSNAKTFHLAANIASTGSQTVAVDNSSLLQGSDVGVGYVVTIGVGTANVETVTLQSVSWTPGANTITANFTKTHASGDPCSRANGSRTGNYTLPAPNGPIQGDGTNSFCFSDGNFYMLVLAWVPSVQNDDTQYIRHACWFGRVTGASLPGTIQKQFDYQWNIDPAYQAANGGTSFPVISRIESCGSTCNQVRVAQDLFLNRSITTCYLPNWSSVTDTPPSLPIPLAP